MNKFEMYTKFFIRCIMLCAIIALAVIGILAPPPGQISSSVLVADGILTVAYLIFNMSSTNQVQLTYKDFSLKINENSYDSDTQKNI